MRSMKSFYLDNHLIVRRILDFSDTEYVLPPILSVLVVEVLNSRFNRLTQKPQNNLFFRRGLSLWRFPCRTAC